LIINRRIVMTTIFAAAATLTTVLLIMSTAEIPVTTLAFAQDDNMTGGNVTEENMTASIPGGSVIEATPPAMAP